MGTSIDESPSVFFAPAEWTFPRLGRKAVPEGARVDTVTDAAVWASFDTDDADLEHVGAALTRRGPDHWRLRLDGQVQTLVCAGRGVPVPLRDALLGVRAGAPLRRVGDVSGELITRVVVDGADRVLGEIDDLRTTDAHGNVVRRVEVTALEPAFGRAVGKRLVGSGAGTADEDEPPLVTVGDAVRRFVHAQRLQVLRGDVRLRRTPTGTDAVHPTRVAIRRLRSALRVVTVFDERRGATLDSELSWFSGVLGAVRDADVLRGHLAGALDRLSADLGVEAGAAVSDAHTAALRALDEQLASAQQRLTAALSARRYLAMLRELRAWDVDGPFTAAADAPVAELTGYARRASKIMHKRLRHAHDPESTHRARKAAKRARYVNELVADTVQGSSAKALRRAAADAKRRQTVLGERQDAVIAAQFLQQMAARADIGAAAAFGCGVLWATEHRAAAG